jgi:hypothetical protein
MSIARITPHEVLSECRTTIGLPADAGLTLDDELIAGLLRRSAGFLCPCSRTALRASLQDCLRFLTPGSQVLSERIDRAIEGLIVVGDLLELDDVATGDMTVKGTWVFAAPPSFVIRPSGTVFLVGIAPDQDLYLPRWLQMRITRDGFSRTMRPNLAEDLAADLQDQGFHRLDERAWLKTPKARTATALLADMKQRLATVSPGGTVEGLEILDHARPVNYYATRWCSPQAQSGIYIARRPQAYGAHIWCFVELAAGTPQRVLDLPAVRSRWRGCDTAWHVQMAIDYSLGHPQVFRRSSPEYGVRFDFFSPIPLWAERRLMAVGRRVPAGSSLLAYVLPDSEADTEEQFLREQLWLTEQGLDV